MLLLYNTMRIWYQIASYALKHLRRTQIVTRFVLNFAHRIERKTLEDVRESSDPAKASRVCVILHVYYLDLLKDYLEAIKSVPKVALLLITTPHRPERIKLHLKANPLVNVERLDILECVDDGSDISAFFKAIEQTRDQNFDAYLKLHTKAATHQPNGYGTSWGSALLKGLLPSEDLISNITTELATNPTIRIAAPAFSFGAGEFWGGNMHTALELLRDPKPRNLLLFPRGSMFWFSESFRDDLLPYTPISSTFTNPKRVCNGSKAHAVERLFGLEARRNSGVIWPYTVPIRPISNYEPCLRGCAREQST
jgi:lipopolysaccharide biosynthesis protein